MQTRRARSAASIALGCLLLAAPARADVWTHVWNPEGSGGWQSAGQYFQADGATPATAAPAEGVGVVKIPENVTVEVSTDGDAAYVSALRGVMLGASTSTFIFNQPSDIDWGCAVCGAGKIIKRSTATITLQSNLQTDILAKYFDGYAAYYTTGGIEIEKGMLIIPQENKVYSFGPIAMSNDTTFVVSPLAKTQMYALDGYGTVSNTASKSTAQYMQIGLGNASDQRASHFHGQINGNGIKWYSFATVYLDNPASTFAGGGFVVYGYTHAAYEGCGNLWFTTFGKKGQSSSIGASYASLESRIGGNYHYLGSGETTDKGFLWRAQTSRQHMMDAGPTGGVTFEGTWSQYNNDTPEADHRMDRLLLTGDNEKPCIVSGKITTATTCNGTNYTTYITKDGTGTWRFANNANEQKGALAIKDGTFQFTSIAETNEPCALGLSTILHEDYYGLRNDSRAVNYAFLLGGNGTFPTFEYMGGKGAACSTRPLALTGSGGRLASSGTGSALTFAGVYSFNAGEKTLMLGGDSVERNVVSNITPGQGSVALAKDGPGRWVLHGSNVISGTLSVKDGTLEIWDRYAPKFTWYRLVIKKVFTSNPAFTPELALYDADGSNRVAGLKFRMPPDYSPDDTLPKAYLPGDPADLEPGETLCHGADSSTKLYLYAGLGSTVAKLFDGTSDGTWRLLAAGGGGMPSDKASSYLYVVMRLPADTPPLVRFDINVGNSVSSGKQQTIEKFAVEASLDGVKWFPMTDDYTVTSPSWNWFSGDAFVDGHPLRQNAGFEMETYYYDAPGSEHVLDSVTSVQVSTGAVLSAKGESKTARGLTIDCASGVGRLEGIEFGADATLKLVNLPADATRIALEADLSALSAASLAKLNACPVTREDGTPTTKWLVKLTESSVMVFRRGFALSIR